MWEIQSYSQAGTKGWPYQDKVLHTKISQGGDLVAVFDGHGLTSQTLEECTSSFPHLLKNATQKNAEKDLSAACAYVAELTRNFNDGASALVGCLWNDGGISIATLGDTTFVASLIETGPLVSGPHHNVRTNLVERSRAIERGGEFDGEHIIDPITKDGVQVGHCFGDADIGSFLSREPDIWEFHVRAGGWIALMSDGLLDPGHSLYLEMRSILRGRIRTQANAKEIVTRFAPQSGDDTSLILCRYT